MQCPVETFFTPLVPRKIKFGRRRQGTVETAWQKASTLSESTMPMQGGPCLQQSSLLTFMRCKLSFAELDSENDEL